MDVAAFLADLTVKLEPLGDRVAVFPDEDEKVSAGGIIRSDTQEKEPKQLGTVVALGSGGMGDDCINPSAHVSIGERVAFGKYAGDDLKFKKKDGKSVTVKILHVEGLIAVCDPV